LKTSKVGTKGMAEALYKLNDCLSYFKDNDVDAERSFSICKIIENAVIIFKNKRRPHSSSQFLLCHKKDQPSVCAATVQTPVREHHLIQELSFMSSSGSNPILDIFLGI